MSVATLKLTSPLLFVSVIIRPYRLCLAELYIKLAKGRKSTTTTTKTQNDKALGNLRLSLIERKYIEPAQDLTALIDFFLDNKMPHLITIKVIMLVP